MSTGVLEQISQRALCSCTAQLEILEANGLHIKSSNHVVYFTSPFAAIERSAMEAEEMGDTFKTHALDRGMTAFCTFTGPEIRGEVNEHGEGSNASGHGQQDANDDGREGIKCKVYRAPFSLSAHEYYKWSIWEEREFGQWGCDLWFPNRRRGRY